jgi:hypothetical protein
MMTSAPLPHVLRLVEGVTHQRITVRLDPDSVELVGDALEVLREDAGVLIAEGRLCEGEAPAFWEIGECLFTIDGEGELGELQPRLRLFRGHEPVTPESLIFFERRPLPGGVEDGREVMVAELTIDRRDCRYNRDWAAFHLRKRRQFAEEIERFLRDSVNAFAAPERAELALSRRNEQDRALLLRAVAQRIHDAPFELYSRFIGRRRLIKDGISTLLHIEAGHGGACSEKAQALRFIADALEIPAQYVLCGPNTRGELPADVLLAILDTFDTQYSTAVQAYWNHVAVLVELEGREVLVDASGGNIPFLWESGEPLAEMLDRHGAERRGVPHRYVVGSDELHYHRVVQELPENLLFALELGWADPHIDLVQALDDELGLMTMPDLWLGGLAYRDEEERATLRAWYDEKWIAPGHVRGVVFTDDLTTAAGPIADELRERYPAVAAAATEARSSIEERLEEANPGARYKAELVLVGRREDLD